MAGSSAIVSAKKRELFLVALADCGNVTQAAKVVGISWRHAFRLRNERADFAAAWDDALQQAADKLEQEAWRRAHDGVDEPVYQGGELVGTVRKYSDTLLIFLLKGARPAKYRENVKVSGSIHARMVPSGKVKAFADEMVTTMQAFPQAQEAILATLARLDEGGGA